MRDFIWFWKNSKKFTGYSWFKLLIVGWKPCFEFMKLQKEELNGR